MDKLLYVAMTGASQNMASQNVHAHNLANVDTPGFKSHFAQARAMPVFGEVHPTRVYAMTESPGINYDQGPMMMTDRDLDIAVNGAGWITVADEQGQEAFTRAGELMIDNTGFVRTRSGNVVMGNAGPLILPAYESLEIGVDGTVTVRALGQGPEGLIAVDRMKLVNPPTDDIEKGADGLFRRKDGEFQPSDFNVRVSRGAIEGSNVNAVESMIAVVSLSRQFEMQVKLMKSAEQMDESAARIMQIT